MTAHNTHTCHGCGESFEPTSDWTWYCPDCARPKSCECRRPIKWHDEDGTRCVRCGRWLDLGEPVVRAGRS